MSRPPHPTTALHNRGMSRPRNGLQVGPVPRTISPRRIATVRRGRFLRIKRIKRGQALSSKRHRSSTTRLQACIRRLRSCTRKRRLHTAADMRGSTGTVGNGTTTAGTRAGNIGSMMTTMIDVCRAACLLTRTRQSNDKVKKCPCLGRRVVPRWMVRIEREALIRPVGEQIDKPSLSNEWFRSEQ